MKKEKRKKKKEKKESYGNKKDNGRIGDLGWGKRSSKVRGRNKKTSTRIFSQVDSCLWKETKWKNTHKKTLRSYNRNKRKVYSEKEKSISIFKRRKRRDMWVHIRAIKKEIYHIFEVISDGTSVLCREEKQEEIYGIRL